ncbi:MAG: quinol:cytochrome C oxidoreductase, partial [Flavobacteriaceae bacterium]
MYTFSGKLKTVSLVLMIIGALSIGYGFFTAPKTTEDVEQAMAHDDGHHGEEASHGETSHGEAADSEEHSEAEAQSHLEHLLHQGQNRPWTAFFIAAFFFLMISVCVLVFYAIQWAAQAGWSIVLFRVMEGITAYILPGSILLFLFLLASGMHMNHIYVWMAEGTFDPSSENYDAIVAGKSWWLNVPGWIIRSFIYLFVYNIFRYLLRKNSLALDTSGDIKIYKKNFNLSIV